MNLTIWFLIPLVLLQATGAHDYDVKQLDFELCKLIDRPVYSRIKIYDGRICYFTVAGDTAKLNQLTDEFRFEESQKMCVKHNKAHLLRIRSKEEAVFIIHHFSILHDYLLESGQVNKILLGLIPRRITGDDYAWDDGTNLTYVPKEWNGYHTAKNRGSQYVYMHALNAKDDDAVIWTSGGRRVTEPVGLVCQLEIEGTTTSPTTADPALGWAPTTADGGGGSASECGWVTTLALVAVVLLNRNP